MGHMYQIWEEYFNDVPRKNLVLIKFGKKSSRQLGSIKWVTQKTKIKQFLKKYNHLISNQDDPRVSLITITSHYKDSFIPEFVVDETIAHEMIHYAHGFNSPLQQLYNHPHKGGVIRKEMRKRGLDELHKLSRAWLKTHWEDYLKTHR